VIFLQIILNHLYLIMKNIFQKLNLINMETQFVKINFYQKRYGTI